MTLVIFGINQHMYCPSLTPPTNQLSRWRWNWRHPQRTWPVYRSFPHHCHQSTITWTRSHMSSPCSGIIAKHTHSVWGNNHFRPVFSTVTTPLAALDLRSVSVNPPWLGGSLLRLLLCCLLYYRLASTQPNRHIIASLTVMCPINITSYSWAQLRRRSL